VSNLYGATPVLTSNHKEFPCPCGPVGIRYVCTNGRETHQPDSSTFPDSLTPATPCAPGSDVTGGPCAWRPAQSADEVPAAQEWAWSCRTHAECIASQLGCVLQLKFAHETHAVGKRPSWEKSSYRTDSIFSDRVTPNNKKWGTTNPTPASGGHGLPSFICVCLAPPIEYNASFKTRDLASPILFIQWYPTPHFLEKEGTMTCPKCLSHAEPIANWTLSGHKMTIPRVDLWACVNQNCRHEWPRDMSSLMQEVA